MKIFYKGKEYIKLK